MNQAFALKQETLLADGITLDGVPVVAADAIAKLSGVDLKTVVKVFTALNAMALIDKRNTVEQLVSIHRVPSAPADDVRYNATEEYVTGLIHELQKAPHRALADRLQVHRRFRNAA